MPKRQVKRVGWEVESECLSMTPAMERRMQKFRLSRAAASLAALENAGTGEEIFHAVANAAFGAYDLERFAEAEAFARKALLVAASFEGNWNQGNVTFTGHTVLGLLALRRGDVEQAVHELHESTRTKGSPQLASFGPTMRLAKELAKRGRTEEVMVFLRHCLAFWTSGNAWVEVWEKKMRHGAVPNFLMNLYP
jgi:hypothetical protein